MTLFCKEKRAVTLIELVVAITLLGVVVLAGITVELAMRRMNIKPRTDSRLKDELIPAIEHIRKNFEFRAVGTIYDSAIRAQGASGFTIRVGDIYNSITIGYNWTGTSDANPSEFQYTPNYYPSVPPIIWSTLATNIASFNYAIGYSNTSLSIYLEARDKPTQPADPIANPSVSINTTLYSRSVSAL